MVVSLNSRRESNKEEDEDAAASRRCSGKEAAERTGSNIHGFEEFHLKAKARIWPSPSYVYHICSTAEAEATGYEPFE